ncbi:MAG: homocysteine S-methyltransferase family protein [Clostridia bacterium]|nr:homocysteine S-methyltransferase family protein [Clostridia bacterium]
MNKIQFFDGGMGTMLQAGGLKAGELPESLNLKNPELVYSVHEAYANAGADIISTNTFGANSLKFDNVQEIVSAAVKLAKKTGKKVALDMGPLGKLLKPSGDLEFEEAYNLYKEVILAAKDEVDIIFFETMTDLYEIKAGVLAAKESCDLPIFVSMMFDSNERLLTGADIETAVTTLEGLGVSAIGMNCGLGPDEMLPLARKMRSLTSLPMLVNPNAGLPRSVDGRTVFDVDAESFAQKMQEIASLGVSYLGGCCGTTPTHIKALVEACGKTESFIPCAEKSTRVSSYSKTVNFAEKPIIIGERINPTGKKLFKEALRNKDIGYIINEGVSQKDRGAHILDVNVGLPEIDENEMMRSAVEALQGVTDLPLQIDTADLIAMETALRMYNGKPMLNSVNGKEESMNSVFPLVKKYGAVVVCLCLDENGIPKTADGRIKIAEKIIAKAEEYGIDKSELIFDALAMTISTDPQGANETLKTVKYLNETLGVKTILGVSNISFGLPEREIVNSNFFNMALSNGLSAGIINPLSDSMMNTYYAFMALRGLDNNCESYIANVSKSQALQTAAQEADLRTAIIKGMKKKAVECTQELVGIKDSLEIINGYIMPALDFVGEGFEKNKIFLPQLLMSAESAKASFEVIKASMPKDTAEKKGEKIILATVHGDIHDIGKNIVKVLLENYGYDVIDLGKDVPEEKVLEVVKENDVKLVGLSALMTTTVPAMERTIELVHKNTDAKVVVGGAVLTQSYAEMINADYYAADATETVKIAKNFFKMQNNYQKVVDFCNSL